MAKTIVTHINPDLDAITAVWLLVRFGGQDFEEAQLAFVPAGERLRDDDPDLVHVDTGLGEFDHHQEKRGHEDTSAAKLVFEWLVARERMKEEEELRRIVNEVRDVDHFREYFWPNPTADRYEFMLHEVLNGIKMGGGVKNDHELVHLGMRALDGVLTAFRIRRSAEEAISQGITFETRWGKTIALESSNSGAIKLALKQGYRVGARKDPELGMIRIKAAPLPEIELSAVYKKLVEADPRATWYFHPSGHMVLNGSTRNPKMRASTLGLNEVIAILKAS